MKSGKIDDKTYENFWKSLLNKEIVKGEILNKKQDGTIIEIESSANPILDDKENIILISISIQFLNVSRSGWRVSTRFVGVELYPNIIIDVLQL